MNKPVYILESCQPAGQRWYLDQRINQVYKVTKMERRKNDRI